MSKTATVWLIEASGFSGASTHRFFDVRMRLDEQRTAALTLQDCRLPSTHAQHDPTGSVAIIVMLASPSALVTQTGPYFG